MDEVGVRRRFPDRRRAGLQRPGAFRHAVLNRHLVDWPELERRPRVAGLTSVVVPTYDDVELTTACVESLVAAGGEIEVVVWDNGSVPAIGAALDAALGGLDRVRVVHAPENYGFALGNNLGAPGVLGRRRRLPQQRHDGAARLAGAAACSPRCPGGPRRPAAAALPDR